MKIAITATGNKLDSEFDLRFGRALWFCIYDDESQTSHFIENKQKDASGGAGTKTTEMIAELGVDQVISGDFGPKAKSLLEKLQIRMVILDDQQYSVGDIIQKLENAKAVV